MYALNLDTNNRILSVTYDEFATEDYPRVETIPEGDVTDYKYINNQYVYEPLPKAVDNSVRIAELKQNLADTDYTVIKIAEGAATWEEYPDIKEQRQAWRAEINKLEAQQQEVQI